MQVTGKLHSFSEVKTFGSNFTKRTFVIVTDEKYPQSIELELHGATVSTIEQHKIGAELECEINIRGRAWENSQGEIKYFNTLVCWKTKSIGKAPADVEPSTAEIPF